MGPERRMVEHPMPKTTPERLAEMEVMMTKHVAEMKAHNDATRAFYAQLSPSQQKAFDELPMMFLSGHEHGMGPGPMMMMHGPMPPPPPMGGKPGEE
jgi:hypothetical protein